MYYRPDSNPPGAVAWRRTGGQGVWSTEQEVAMLLLQSFVIIDIIITIISIIIAIILIINTFISTEIIDHHDRCWSHQREGTAQASTHVQRTTSLGFLDQGRSSLMLNVSGIWKNIFLVIGYAFISRDCISPPLIISTDSPHITGVEPSGEVQAPVGGAAEITCHAQVCATCHLSLVTRHLSS